MRRYRLEVTADARADVADILSWLTRAAGRRVASDVVRRINVEIRRSREWPLTGAPRPKFGETTRMTTSDPYVIYFETEGDLVRVLRVLHGSRDRDAIMAANDG